MLSHERMFQLFSNIQEVNESSKWTAIETSLNHQIFFRFSFWTFKRKSTTNVKRHAFIQITSILRDIFDFPLFKDVNFDLVKLPSRPYLMFMAYWRWSKKNERNYDGRFISYGISREDLVVRSQFYYFLQISITLSRSRSSNLFTFMSVIFIAYHLSVEICHFPFNTAINTFSTT